MHLEDVYNRARAFLEAARPTPDVQYKRRVGVLPYAVLEALPGIAAILGGGDGTDNPEDDSDGNTADPCVYNLSDITALTCPQIVMLYGAAACAPPYMVVDENTGFDGFACYYNGDGAWACGSVSSIVVETTTGNLSSGGVWAGGTQPIEGVAAYIGLGIVSLFQLGVNIANAAHTFTSGDRISLVISPDGLSAIVVINNIPVIGPMAIAAIMPGYVGLVGASKGHKQTLSVVDCRCTP